VIRLAVSALAALACGASLARLSRGADESGATTATRVGLGAVGAVVVVEELLGASGRLGAGAIGLALAAAAVALALVTRRSPALARRATAPWTPLDAGLLAALLVALATRVGQALTRTTFLYDTLSYHLHAPATWLADGRLSIVPAVFGDPAPAYAPSNVELLAAFVLAPTRAGALAQAVQAPLAALACAAVAATVSELCRPRAAALAAALAFLLVPEVWTQSASAMTDVGAAAFLLAALPFLVRLRRGVGGAGDAAALGCAVGLCAGAKVAGAVLVAPVVVAAALACARIDRGGARRLASLLAVGAATGAFFYARDALVTGNPIYPLRLSLAGATLAPGVYDAAALRASPYHLARGDLAGLGRLLLAPGLAFAVGGAATLALRLRRPAWTALALAQVALFWLVLPYQESRFLFPLWGVVAIAMGALVKADGARASSAWWWMPLALAVLGSVVEQPTGERWAALGAGAVAAVIFPRARALLPLRLGADGRAWVAAAVLGALGVALLPVREPAYAMGDELDDAWAWVRANVRGARVAYTGNNLPVPLAGRALENDVRYVNVAGGPDDRLHDFARRAPRAWADPEPAPYRDGARYDVWLANLRAARRDVLFVAALFPEVRATIAADADGFPVERAWADAHADVFTLRYASPAARVYGVRP
jgi:hypothetical protein